MAPDGLGRPATAPFRPASIWTGALARRLSAPPGQAPEPTCTVEPAQVQSDGLQINGWLYLPRQAGRRPLVVLTNGGGNDARAITSVSESVAPVLAHCGIAAFVHDNRGRKLTEADRRTALNLFGDLPVRVEHEMAALAFTTLPHLAAGYWLPVYDAASPELARRRRLVLACKDGLLRAAVRRCGVKRWLRRRVIPGSALRLSLFAPG